VQGWAVWAGNKEARRGAQWMAGRDGIVVVFV
jgi:hypothetical protein